MSEAQQVIKDDTDASITTSDNLNPSSITSISYTSSTVSSTTITCPTSSTPSISHALQETAETLNVESNVIASSLPISSSSFISSSLYPLTQSKCIETSIVGESRTDYLDPKSSTSEFHLSVGSAPNDCSETKTIARSPNVRRANLCSSSPKVRSTVPRSTVLRTDNESDIARVSSKRSNFSSSSSSSGTPSTVEKSQSKGEKDVRKKCRIRPWIPISSTECKDISKEQSRETIDEFCSAKGDDQCSRLSPITETVSEEKSGNKSPLKSVRFFGINPGKSDEISEGKKCSTNVNLERTKVHRRRVQRSLSFDSSLDDSRNNEMLKTFNISHRNKIEDCASSTPRDPESDIVPIMPRDQQTATEFPPEIESVFKEIVSTMREILDDENKFEMFERSLETDENADEISEEAVNNMTTENKILHTLRMLCKYNLAKVTSSVQQHKESNLEEQTKDSGVQHDAAIIETTDRHHVIPLQIPRGKSKSTIHRNASPIQASKELSKAPPRDKEKVIEPDLQEKSKSTISRKASVTQTSKGTSKSPSGDREKAHGKTALRKEGNVHSKRPITKPRDASSHAEDEGKSQTELHTEAKEKLPITESATSSKYTGTEAEYEAGRITIPMIHKSFKSIFSDISGIPTTHRQRSIIEQRWYLYTYLIALCNKLIALRVSRGDLPESAISENAGNVGHTQVSKGMLKETAQSSELSDESSSKELTIHTFSRILGTTHIPEFNPEYFDVFDKALGLPLYSETFGNIDDSMPSTSSVPTGMEWMLNKSTSSEALRASGRPSVDLSLNRTQLADDSGKDPRVRNDDIKETNVEGSEISAVERNLGYSRSKSFNLQEKISKSSACIESRIKTAGILSKRSHSRSRSLSDLQSPKKSFHRKDNPTPSTSGCAAKPALKGILVSGKTRTCQKHVKFSFDVLEKTKDISDARDEMLLEGTKTKETSVTCPKSTNIQSKITDTSEETTKKTEKSFKKSSKSTSDESRSPEKRLLYGSSDSTEVKEKHASSTESVLKSKISKSPLKSSVEGTQAKISHPYSTDRPTGFFADISVLPTDSHVSDKSEYVADKPKSHDSSYTPAIIPSTSKSLESSPASIGFSLSLLREIASYSVKSGSSTSTYESAQKLSNEENIGERKSEQSNPETLSQHSSTSGYSASTMQESPRKSASKRYEWDPRLKIPSATKSSMSPRKRVFEASEMPDQSPTKRTSTAKEKVRSPTKRLGDNEEHDESPRKKFSGTKKP